ncbi:DUF6233 domain-containing protein [Streptomyces canus]|uniref:DUF6233 domain-containing protein n=1 Tax=Streptomyces canus TaxID=58343 RepID=UPI0027D84F46|nr:DUF6233 domain-containing protein [Streptomyces canus]
MHDSSPSRLVLLRFLERVQERDLACTRRWIVEEERREAERRRGVEARPPVPSWLIEQSIGHHAPPVYVHAGDCHMAGKRSKGVARDAALRALTDGIVACPHCRPDTQLGLLD